MPRVSLHTLGCKLNFAETSALGAQFLRRGFEIVEFGEPADVCVINTCSVTERADRECRQVIRKALRTSPAPYVVVTGCYAQLEPEEIASMPGVDLVIGSKEKFDLFAHADDFRKHSCVRVCVSDIETVDNFGPAYSTTTADRTRAFLKVQDGCDYTCSFCTIPLARGASRSQPIDATVAQARMLVSEGFKEIVLTGVNVGDFGRKSGTSLLALLKELVRVEGLARIRISSIEPNLLTDDIIDFVASSDIMCHHFHIPLQSGSDEILGAMRRRYRTGLYEQRIHRVKEAMPDCGIGVDVIVGFPGETERHYEEAYMFLNSLPVSYLHVFTYSERPNTPATVYGNVVEPKVRFKRNEMLRILSAKKRHAFSSSMVGRTERVLFEGDIKSGARFGFTSHYIRVGAPADTVGENEIVPVRITGVTDGVCEAVRADRQAAA